VCATWSLTLGEEGRLRVLKNMMVRKLLRPSREEVTDTGKNCIIRSYMILLTIICIIKSRRTG